MHKDFAEWHRSAGMEPKAETLLLHWKAIEEYTPTPKEIVSLARLFYRLGTPDEAFLGKFRLLFQEKDPPFPMRDNLLQMAVLAGAELVAVIEKQESEALANLAALCLVSAAAQNIRPHPAVPEIPGIAAHHIERQARARAVPDKTQGEAKSDSELQILKRELEIVGEETNMLWWLVSECSRDLNKPWKQVGHPAAFIIAGKELADLTRVMPGPVAALAFLDKITRFAGGAKTSVGVKVSEAIEKTPIEWRRSYVSEPWPIGLEDIVPLSKGVKLSLTVPDGVAWSSIFQQGTGIESTSNLLPHALAYQVFLECLLIRSSGKIE
ncbi:MAG: GTPase-associated system all-helical protein GASH [Candidatus Dormibacteria bacterium]